MHTTWPIYKLIKDYEIMVLCGLKTCYIQPITQDDFHLIYVVSYDTCGVSKIENVFDRTCYTNHYLVGFDHYFMYHVSTDYKRKRTT